MAELHGFDFNPDTVTDRPGKTLLPVGDYVVEVTESDFKTTKDGLGQYINLEFTIIAGERIGRKFFINLNVVNNSEKTVEYAQRDLKDLLRATYNLGKPFKNTLMLHNIPVNVHVTMGKRSNSVEDENRFRFSAINESAPSNAPTTTAPAASVADGGNGPKKKPWEK
jgi:hypothetical protein